VAGRPRWRTGELPGPVLVLGYLVVVAGSLALASTGSWLGVAGMIVLMALAALTIYLWSDAPGADGAR
jgi:hypothetical protein